MIKSSSYIIEWKRIILRGNFEVNSVTNGEMLVDSKSLCRKLTQGSADGIKGGGRIKSGSSEENIVAVMS